MREITQKGVTARRDTTYIHTSHSVLIYCCIVHRETVKNINIKVKKVERSHNHSPTLNEESQHWCNYYCKQCLGR
jgi:hypothetical protein